MTLYIRHINNLPRFHWVGTLLFLRRSPQSHLEPFRIQFIKPYTSWLLSFGLISCFDEFKHFFFRSQACRLDTIVTVVLEDAGAVPCSTCGLGCTRKEWKGPAYTIFDCFEVVPGPDDLDARFCRWRIRSRVIQDTSSGQRIVSVYRMHT